MAELDPNVAKLSPSLYSAAYYAGLNGQQINSVNQIAGTVALNKELSGLPTDRAAARWNTLDPHAQEQIKAMYGDASYIPKPKDNLIWRGIKDVAGIVEGPFKAAFKAAGEYNRAINTPYLVYRQISQGSNPFSWSVYKNAFDGTNVFDKDSLASLHQEYGNTDTFVAMKTLQGLKPGEIVDAYGQVNGDIIKSLTKMFNEPEKFQNMLNQFKAAQISPGRDIARIMFNASPSDHKLYGSQKWNKVSGLIDAVYQVVIDPLTWATGGTSKLATRADKLSVLLAKDPSEANIAKVFARNDVRDTWDKAAGPLVKNFAEAPDLNARRIARNEITRQMPDLNNDNILHLLATNKVFDAESAKTFFSKSEAMLDLLSGRVDGTTFFRTGIPIAKRSRNITSGLNKAIGDFFNGAEDVAVSSDFVNDLHKIGVAADPIHASQTPMLEGITKELESGKRKLGRLMARFPADREINITDEGVHKTLPLVRSLARTIYPKAHADFLAEAFADSNAYDRVIVLRGLYTQIMHNLGMHGSENGQAMMRQILQEKFADTTSFLSRSDLAVPPQHESFLKSRGILEEQPAQGMGGLLKTSYAGPVNFYNGKPTIGNLPWSAKSGEASLADYAFNNSKTVQGRKLIDAVGGATRNAFLRKAVNGWTVATLFPRLGIRSALDETFMYSMMAPGEDLFKLALGRKLHNSIIAFSGADKGIPPVKKAILNWMDKNPANAVELEKRFVKTTINGEERLRLESRENIATEVVKAFDQIIPPHLHDKMYQAMVHHPEIASAMVNSIIGKSGLDQVGIVGGDLASIIVSNSHLTNLWKDLGFKPTGKYKEWQVEDLAKINESAVSAAHFKNWFMRFTRNAHNFIGDTDGYIHAGETFIRNNALRTGEDFEHARDYILQKVGVNPETMAVADEKALQRYLELSQQTARDSMNGWTGVETAVKRVETMLLDMYNTFHGSGVAFNDRLYNHIRETAGFLQSTEKMGSQKAIREALNTVDGKTFEELTRGFRPEGKINTDIGFSKVDSNEGFMQQISAWAEHAGFDSPMEWMDAQNNHLFRQPALWATYAKLRERYDALEKKYVDELYRTGMKMDLATELAEKKFTEVAMNHAANYVLRASDNPLVRSNLSWTLRTTGRFYRATEDFYRRVYRLKDVSPQVLYRMRVAHLGLQSNGFIHPDQNGDPYLVMPADNLIFAAFNAAGAALTGNPDAIKQPMFNEFAVKIAMGNPSFQQDAGQPSLSGPLVAVPILAIQKMLKSWGGDLGARVAKDLDNRVLGNVNQNLDWTKALVPSSVQRVWAMLPKDEQDQQEVSAAMQAVAYNAAHGNILSPAKYAALPQEERARALKKYQDDIRVSAHNVIFMRAFLGFISPIAPTMQESKDVPAYLKNAGINGLRPEFADILQGVMRNSKGRIQDPYEAALMAFTGKYPGKLVYTVARDDRQTNVLVNKTKETQNWMLSNGKNINTYGDAAFIFAPHTGEYNSDVYTWMQAAGLMQQRKLGDYLDEVMIAQDRQKYFDYKAQAEQLFTNPAYNAMQRQQILDKLKGAQDQLKKDNPLLEEALNSKSFGIGKQQKMADSLAGILSDPNFKMDPAVRAKMATAFKIYKQGLDAIRNDMTSDVVNSGASKQEAKQRVLAAIRELGGSTGKNAPQDPMLAEASRAIFQPILDFYVRNNMRAGA